MGYGLGVDLGTTYTAAAVRHGDTTEVLTLGVRRAEVPSVVYVGADGAVLVGEPAARRGQSEPGRTAREFKRRLGDPVPLLVGGAPYSPHALMARQLEHVVAAATAAEGEPPAAVVVTCPANWGPYKRELLQQATRLADLGSAALRTEPEAAAVQFAAGSRISDGEIIAVYDLGGGTFDAAVLQRTRDGFVLLGEPEGIEQLGGVDFDEAVFEHVLATLGVPAEELPADDADVVAALARLRSDCVEAKESLSADTEVLIPVALPGLHTRIRLTRGEFETMIGPPLTETVGAMRRALRSARVRPEQLRAVLLAGGSSRIPLVTQVLGTSFGRPTVLDPHPEHSIALGAARLTGPIGTPEPTPMPATGAAAVDTLTSDAVSGLPTTVGRAPTLAPVPGSLPVPDLGAVPVSASSEGRALSPTPARDAVAAAAGVSAPGSRMPVPAYDAAAGGGGLPDTSTTPTARSPRRWPRLLVAGVAVLVVVAAVTAVVKLTGREESPNVAACGFQDDFAGDALDPAWRQTRPDARVVVADGVAKVTAPDGADIYETFLDAPMLLRQVAGTFVATADVTADPSQFYQGAGVILWDDAEHYVRVERGRGEADVIIFEYKNDGTHQQVHSTRLGDPDTVRTDVDQVVLELARTGSTVRARWHPADQPAWSDLGSITMDLHATVHIGASVLNRAQRGAKPATFDATFTSFAVAC